MLDLETANRQLRISEERYRLSFENVRDIIFLIDADFNISSITPSLEKILGYRPADYIGRPVYDFIKVLTPGSFEQAIANMRSVLRGEGPRERLSLRTAYGDIRYGEVSAPPFCAMEGSRMIVIARDVTDRKKLKTFRRASSDTADLSRARWRIYRHAGGRVISATPSRDFRLCLAEEMIRQVKDIGRNSTSPADGSA